MKHAGHAKAKHHMMKAEHHHEKAAHHHEQAKKHMEKMKPMGRMDKHEAPRPAKRASKKHHSKMGY